MYVLNGCGFFGIDLVGHAIARRFPLGIKMEDAPAIVKMRIEDDAIRDWLQRQELLVQHPEMRKPFDVPVEGLVSRNSRGDRRWTFPNQSVDTRLLWSAIAQTMEFSADTFFALGT